MATHLSLVNQKLGFATSMLSLADTPLEGVQSNHNLLQQAIYEATLLHLYTAFHFYLRELAERNGIKSPESINSLEALNIALRQLAKDPSEVAELTALTGEQGGWLGELLRTHTQIFNSPSRQIEKKSFSSDHLIALVDLTQKESNEAKELTSDLLRFWMLHFKALILRHRETGAEY